MMHAAQAHEGHTHAETTAAPSRLDTTIALFEERAIKRPGNYTLQMTLANLYLRKAGIAGSHAYFEKAEGLLRAVLASNPDDAAATYALASALMGYHRFGEALALVESVAESETSVDGLAVHGDALLELGRYAEAKAVYGRLRQESDAPAVLARLARLAEIEGDPGHARELLEVAVRSADTGALLRQQRAWYHARLGMLYFDSNKLDLALREAEAALKLDEGCAPAFALAGRVYGVRGEWKKAIEQYLQAEERAPSLEILSALSFLYGKAGNAKAAQAHVHEALHLIGEDPLLHHAHRRQVAQFYADHEIELERAVLLAQRDLEARRDIFSFDTLAWTLHKAGRHGEAADAVEKALAMGTKSALLHYHAGCIYEALGQLDRAQDHFATVDRINPNFSMRYGGVSGQAAADGANAPTTSNPI